MPNNSGTAPGSAGAYSPSSAYYNLGGWLAVIAYGMLIAVILIVIGAVMGGFALLKYARYMGIGLFLLGLFDIAIYIPVVYFCLKMFRMIKEKDYMFLRFYEMTMLTLGGIHIVLMVIGAAFGFLSPGEHFKSLLEAVIIFAIWLTYFKNSVRVRTYFGGEKYLEHSIVFNLIKQYRH